MKGILTLIILLSSLISPAQIDIIQWQKCLGTENGENQPHAVEKCGTGYLFGIDLEEDGPGVTNYHGASDAWIVKTDIIGNTIWERCYGGSNGDGSQKIININDSTLYLLNDTYSEDGDVQNGRNGNFWVVKINASGNIIWENSFGGTINGENIMDGILLPDEGLLLMGSITSSGGDVTNYYGMTDIWFCKINSLGTIEWQKTFGNQGDDNAIKIKLTSNNTVLMIGGHYESGGMIDCPDLGTDGPDVWILEMDLQGNLLNQWCYGGSRDDLGRDIIELEDGYVFAASTNSNDGDVSGFHGNEWNENPDYWIVKIDLNGNIIWQKCLGGTNYEYPVYLTQTGVGGFVIIGNTWSDDGDVTGNHSWDDLYTDIWVVKLNSEGQLEWEHCFGGGGMERFNGIHSVLKKDDYNYVLGANSNYLDADVECDLFPNDLQDDAWLFEIKDCNYYLPEAPVIHSGPDTLCTIANPVSSYSIDTVQSATGYEWRIQPDSAGSVLSDSVSSQVTWHLSFEGQVTIQARSFNDCGYSAWSESFITQVYTCMGVEEHGGVEAWGHGGMEVWPNPAREILNFKFLILNSGRDYSISIYDIFGREVQKIKVAEEQDEVILNVESYPPGVYIAILKNGFELVESRKFVVAR